MSIPSLQQEVSNQVSTAVLGAMLIAIHFTIVLPVLQMRLGS